MTSPDDITNLILWVVPELRAGKAIVDAVKGAEEAAALGENSGISQAVMTRAEPGADGGLSRHIIERQDGRTISGTHQVTRNGEVVHQHQTHVGTYGGQRQFPNDWAQFPTLP